MTGRRALVATGGGLAALAVAAAALAQSASGWEISLRSYSGGGTSSGGGYVVQGAIGQPVVTTSTSAQYTVATGIFAAISEKFKRVAPFLARDGVN